MAVSTGIEIAGNTVRCVVLEGSAKAPRLVSAFQEVIKPAQEGENGQAHPDSRIAEIIKGKAIPTSNTVLAIDGRQVYSREVVVPFARSEQIQKTIKFEVEEYMPAAPVESMIIDYYYVGQAGEKSRILVCGVQKSVIETALELCRSADFEPRALDYDAACLANAGYAAGIFEPPAPPSEDHAGPEPARHTTSVLLDVSQGLTRLALVENGRLRRARTFIVPFEGNHPSEKAVAKLAREVKRTEASCSLASPVSVTYVTGPVCNEELVSALGKALGIGVERLQTEKIFHDLEQEKVQELQSAGACALGAALKGLGIDNVAIDFRKEEFILHRAFSQLKAGLSCAACIAFFIAFFLAYSLNLRMSQDRFTLETIRKKAKETFVTLLPGEQLKGYDTHSILKSFKDALEKRKSGRISEKVPKVISALDIFKDFGESVARAKIKSPEPKSFFFKLLECTIDQNTVRIVGVVTSRLEGELIKKEIEARSKYLKWKSDSWDDKKGEIVYTYRFSIKEAK